MDRYYEGNASEEINKIEGELMNNSTQNRRWVPGIRGRAAGTALALAILLLLTVVLAAGPAQAQNTYGEEVLHSFCYQNHPYWDCWDGEYPSAGLVQDAQGNLYGTAMHGGLYECQHGCGTVFKLDTSGNETVLYSFTGGNDGSYPAAGLVLDAQGYLYGTASAGGGSEGCGYDELRQRNYGCGTVFKVSTSGGATALYSFTGTGGDGSDPLSSLIMDAQGNLYGTTNQGGANGYGTVFELDTSGNETVLYSFTGNTDGAGPSAGLVQDAQGNLYGTTNQGGANDYGTVFEVDTSSNETVLYSFCSQAGCVDGAGPSAGLVQDAQGNLYGTTNQGGANGYGTVFKLDTSDNETVLYSFCSQTGCADGEGPLSNLIMDAQGNLYGTTNEGGANGYGTVFKVDASGNETVLYSFTGIVGDGSNPSAGLMMDAQGNLYGTTYSGGARGYGTVFAVRYGEGQTITVTAPAPAIALRSSNLTSSSFTVVATASSALPVSFNSFGDCTNQGATFTMGSGKGTCLVAMNQAGDGTYAPAPTVVETTNVILPIAPTVTFTGAPATAVYQSTFPVSATSNSGATPTITATGACTISGTTVTMSSGTGTCILAAAWPAYSLYKAASLKHATIAKKITPTVTFTGAPTSAPYQSTYQVAATTNASTSPVITAAPATVCTIDNTETVTLISGAGVCSLTARWAADNDYNVAYASQKTTAEKLASAVTWATPAPITYGTPLSATQLDATANVAGRFSYSPKANALLAAGTQTLSVAFKPTLNKDYAGSNDSVELTVNAADTTTTISKATAPKATPLVVTVTFAVASQNVGSKAPPTGSVTVTDSVSATTCTGTLASGKGSCVLTFPSAEMSPPASLTATYSPDNANNNASASTPPLSVNVL